METDDEHRFEQLLDLYFEGEPGDASMSELDRMLAGSPELRGRFWERATLEEGLGSWGNQQRGEAIAWMNNLQTSGPPDKRMMYGGWAAACALLVAWGVHVLWNAEDTRGPAPSVERQQVGPQVGPQIGPADAGGYPVAYLSRLVGVESPVRYLGGQALGAGEEVMLDEGLMEVVFFSGARLTVKGPAQFVAKSDLEIEFLNGGAEAVVPESAIGFKLVLPDGVITDFGTSFDVSVEEGATSRVQVLDGEIEFDPAGNAVGPKRMFAGEAISVVAGGRMETAEFRPQDVGASLETLSAAEDRVRMTRWMEVAGKLDEDPGLLVHFSLLPDEAGSIVINNHARHAVAPRSGTVISADWSKGRWKGKPALSFRRPSDRVRIDIPGDYPTATFIAWARVDGLPREYNGLFYSECGINGEVHWQFSSSGAYQFGVRPLGAPIVSPFHRAFSPPVISSWAFGSWRMFATTYDAEAREVVHYVDAAEVSRTTLPDSIPLRFGRATLGNFFDPLAEQHADDDALSHEWSFRNWTGAIDEFLIFSRVVSTEELRDLYEIGKVD